MAIIRLRLCAVALAPLIFVIGLTSPAIAQQRIGVNSAVIPPRHLAGNRHRDGWCSVRTSSSTSVSPPERKGKRKFCSSINRRFPSVRTRTW